MLGGRICVCGAAWNGWTEESKGDLLLVPTQVKSPLYLEGLNGLVLLIPPLLYGCVSSVLIKMLQFANT